MKKNSANVYTAKDLMVNTRNVDSKKSLILSVFTHPACSGCGAAVEMGWELVQDFEGLQLKTVKLENREGLERAQQCGIKTIPTMIIYKGEEECERMVGLPKKKDLEESLKLYLD
jgi:thioredoxin 1